MAALYGDAALDSVLRAVRVIDIGVVGVVVLGASLIALRIHGGCHTAPNRSAIRWLGVALAFFTVAQVAGAAWFRVAMTARANESARFVNRQTLDWPVTKVEFAKTLASIDGQMLVAFRDSAVESLSADAESDSSGLRYSAVWLMAVADGTVVVVASLSPWRRPASVRAWALAVVAVTVGVANAIALMLGADEYLGLVFALRMQG